MPQSGEETEKTDFARIAYRDVNWYDQSWKMAVSYKIKYIL